MPRPISFRWHEDFIARIDDARGDVPRSAFVRRAVEFYIAANTERRPVSDATFAATMMLPDQRLGEDGEFHAVSRAERMARPRVSAKGYVAPIPKKGGPR